MMEPMDTRETGTVGGEGSGDRGAEGGLGGEGRAGGWRWESYPPERLPSELLDLPEDVKAEMSGEVVLVWKEVGGAWRRWVVVMESAMLRLGGLEGQRGLYAWGELRAGEAVGSYEGERIMAFKEGDRKAAERRCGERLQGMYVLEKEVSKVKREWIDGRCAGPPYLQYANDARGMTTEAGRVRVNTGTMDEQLTLRTRVTLGGDEAWAGAGQAGGTRW